MSVLARPQLAKVAALLTVALSGCVDVPERPRALSPQPEPVPPPVLSVGLNDRSDPHQIDRTSAIPADLSCLGEPVIRVGGPRSVSVVVSEPYLLEPAAGWCVVTADAIDAARLECDPDRDPVSDADGVVSQVLVDPGRFAIFGGAPAGLRSEVRDVLMIERSTNFDAIDELELPIRTPRVQRLFGLTSGRPVSAPSSPVLFVAVQDCAGFPVYGANVEVLGQPEAAVYFDGFSLPAAEQAWTHTDGVAGFEPLDAPPATEVLVQVTGRLAADRAPEVVACAWVPIRPRTETLAVLDPRRAGDPDCGAPP